MLIWIWCSCNSLCACDAGIFTALIGVMYQVSSGMSREQCHMQGSFYQFRIVMLTHSPSDNFTRIRIEHSCPDCATLLVFQWKWYLPSIFYGVQKLPASRKSRFGATGKRWVLLVVRTLCLFFLALICLSRISRATRFLPQRIPCAFNSAWIRGLPYFPLLLWYASSIRSISWSSSLFRMHMPLLRQL